MMSPSWSILRWFIHRSWGLASSINMTDIITTSKRSYKIKEVVCYKKQLEETTTACALISMRLLLDDRPCQILIILMIWATVLACPLTVPPHHRFTMVSYLDQYQYTLLRPQNQAVMARFGIFGILLVKSFRQASMQLRAILQSATAFSSQGQKDHLNNTWAQLLILLQRFLMLYQQIQLFSQPLLNKRTISSLTSLPIQPFNKQTELKYYVTGSHSVCHNRHNSLVRLNSRWVRSRGKSFEAEVREMGLGGGREWDVVRVGGGWPQTLFILSFLHLGEDRRQGGFMLCSSLGEGEQDLSVKQLLGSQYCGQVISEEMDDEMLDQFKLMFQQEIQAQDEPHIHPTTIFQLEEMEEMEWNQLQAMQKQNIEIIDQDHLF